MQKANIILGGNEKELLDHPVGKVSQWWQGVRNILSSSELIAQSLMMAVVCRSVAMEMTAASQKIKVSSFLINLITFLVLIALFLDISPRWDVCLQSSAYIIMCQKHIFQNVMTGLIVYRCLDLPPKKFLLHGNPNMLMISVL